MLTAVGMLGGALLGPPAAAAPPSKGTAPDTVLDARPADVTSSTSATFAFHATLAGATFMCALDGVKAGCTSPWSYSPLAPGSHTFTVTAKVQGTSDPSPATATWTVDTTPPTTPTNLSASASSPTAVQLSWTAATDASGIAGYDVYRDGSLLSTVTSTTATDSTISTGTFYRYAVRARDVAGNTSSLTPTVLAQARAPYDAHLTRAPYLTDLVGTHVAVTFATDQSATTATLRYGAVDASGTCSATTELPATRSTVLVGAVAEYQWTTQLDLPRSGTWCYRPLLAGTDLLAGNPSPRFTTQEAVGSTAPFSFAVFGDWGQVDSTSTNTDQSNVLAQVAASGVRFAVTVGDNGYPNGSQVNYGDLQQTGADTSAVFGKDQWTVPGATVPIFTASGNHGKAGTQHTDLTSWPQDRTVAASGGRYQDDVYCCVNGSSPAHYASEWYAFSAGNARFYVLDSAWSDGNVGTGDPYSADALAHFTPGTPEWEWLQQDLTAHDDQLKFAFGHFPLHVDNPNEASDTYLTGADRLEGLLGSHGVQLVFNGHAHLYERNTPSGPGMPTSYVTGGGGAALEPIGPCTAQDAYGIGWSPTKGTGTACGAATVPSSAAAVYHFLKVTVSGTTVTVAPTDSLGRTFDVQTYSYDLPPDTYFDSRPPAGTTSSSATFAFHSSSSTATFTCSLDGAGPTPCTSPVTVAGLAEGSHAFSVAATDGGVTDPRPAVATWVVDSTPPQAPTGLAAQATSPFDVHLTWAPASDNTGVTGYRVYRDGVLLDSTTATAFDDVVAGGTTHAWTVVAVDVAGNLSGASDPVVVTTPPPPAPLFADGFESGGLQSWTSSAGLTVQGAVVHSGSQAAEAATTNGGTYAKRTLGSTYPDAYARVLVDVLSSASQVNLLRLRDSAGNSLAYVFVDVDGHVGLRNDTTATTAVSSVQLGSGWHAVELRLATDSSAGTATGALQVWVDGHLVDALSSTAVDTGTAPTGVLQIGETQTGRTYDVVFDDVAFGTSRLGPDPDTTPPSAPGQLTATPAGAFEVDLGWAPSTDDVGVAGYDVFRDGVRIGTTSGTSWVDRDVLAFSTYAYVVQARDASGNTATSDVAGTTTPAAAAPLFADGFESGDLSAWTSSAGLVVEGQDVRSGVGAAEGATTSGATYARKTLPTTYTDGYARVAFEVKSASSIVGLLRLRTATGTSLGVLQRETSGRLSFRADATGVTTTSTVAPGPGWHVLELHLDVAGGAVQTWLDGAAVPSLSYATSLGSAPIGSLQVGESITGRTYDVVLDDAAFSTSRIGLG